MPRKKDAVYVAPASIGQGLFANRRFAIGETILHVAGRVYDADVLWKRGGTFADNCYRFGPETYLDPGEGPGRYANHSCEPNAAVRKHLNRLYLVAVRPIRPGTEITFDYSTILGDDDIWTMRCKCGTPSCRRRIKRFGSLPSDLQDDYIARGMVPGFIRRTLGWPWD